MGNFTSMLSLKIFRLHVLVLLLQDANGAIWKLDLTFSNMVSLFFFGFISIPLQLLHLTIWDSSTMKFVLSEVASWKF